MITQDQPSRLGAFTGEDDRITTAFSAIRARGGAILNIQKTLCHSPAMLLAQATYAGALRADSSIPRSTQELLILRVCQLQGGAYEWSVHVHVAQKLGVPQAKIEALETWAESTDFTQEERVALAFVDQAAGDSGVDEPTFQAALRVYGRLGVVDLASHVAWYVGNTRFTRALGIVPETQAP